MQKRTVEKLGVTVSRLGFGAMRMPERDGAVDFTAAQELVDCLHQGGVNFFDTAYFYHNGGSETFLKQALVDRYPRDSYHLSSKLPVGMCRVSDDMNRLFNLQRERLGVSRIDFYMLHGIGADEWARDKALGAPDFLRRLKADGCIGFHGFSFHDKPEALATILDDFPWDFCLLQINYADWFQRGADRLYEAAAQRGVPIFVMEPVRGGGLTRLPPEMQAIKDSQAPSISSAAWALSFCASLPRVDVILSGMSTVEQCRENVKLFAKPLTRDEGDLEAMRRVALAFDKMPSIPCTDCRYCANCPQGIDIPRLFSGFNDYNLYQNTWGLEHFYRYEVPDRHKATACTRCGACEAVCPQKIAVMEELARVHNAAARLWE